MSGATELLPKPANNAVRNEKDRERRADGLLRHQKAPAPKQAEIDHLTGILTQAMDHMQNYRGNGQHTQT
jgi:hypothetical protein